MTFIRIDHTAIAVQDLDEALPRYRQLYGVEESERGRVPDQDVEVAFLPIGDTNLELVQPTDRNSGVARFLSERGESLHHIGILVSDIQAELLRLDREGRRLIDRSPRRGLHGRIAFIHPKAAGGVLVELVELSPIEAMQA